MIGGKGVHLSFLMQLILVPDGLGPASRGEGVTERGTEGKSQMYHFLS